MTDTSAPKPANTPKDGEKANPQSGSTSSDKQRENSFTGVDDKTKNVESGKANPQSITKDVHGVEGNVDLTKDGALKGDGSVRTDSERNLEKLNETLNKNSGPNPTPLREGNEKTKGINAFDAGGGPTTVMKIDADTSGMANELRDILRNNGTSFNHDDRSKMNDIIDRLDRTGK